MLIDCAIALINAVKKKQRSETIRILNLMDTFVMKDAEDQLKSDTDKMIFWVNIYNAFFQIKATDNQKEFLTQRSTFFRSKQVNLFGLSLSFDDIEHGILRRSKWKPSLGYLGKLFTQKWERKLRVRKLDYRIHFMLNCGAESCPVIYPLTQANFENEFKVSTKAYLHQEVSVNELNKEIVLNQLFLFYLGDFGGKKKLRNILLSQGLINKNQMGYKFKFTPFNKQLKLHHFTD